MASSFFSLSPLFSSPLHLTISHKPTSCPSSSSSNGRNSFLVLSSSGPCANEVSTSEEKKRLLLERYGLDLSEFTSRRSQRSRKRREEQMELRKKGKGRLMAGPPLVHERKESRTTHKLLKVLGGIAHRKKLLSPKGMDVRPMMEVVRGAAFDILQVAGGCPASLMPGRWLDLYSGTGSVGIEAISRGCSEAHFVEMDPWVIKEVLTPNLEWTGFLDASVIHRIRVEEFLKQAAESPGEDRHFDYVSVTPPYTAVDYSMLLTQLGNSPLVGKDCFILVEYPLETTMLDSCGHLVKISDRRFGRTNLIIYGPEWAQKKRKSQRS